MLGSHVRPDPAAALRSEIVRGPGRHPGALALLPRSPLARPPIDRLENLGTMDIIESGLVIRARQSIQTFQFTVF